MTNAFVMMRSTLLAWDVESSMGAWRKITVAVQTVLLEKVQRVSGTGISETVRTGLELLAASHACERLRQMRGQVRFSRTCAVLKADR